jgi:hypothetical protein
MAYYLRIKGTRGVLDLEIQNKSLLSKWLYKLINEDGDWQYLLRNKYLTTMSLTQVRKNLVTLDSGRVS